MLTILDGVVRDSRVKVVLIPALAHGPLTVIDGIIVHQTDSSTASGTLAGYRTSAKGLGTHFLIDKDGTVYQTASLNQKCWHVGPIKSRCFEEHKCTPAQMETYQGYMKQGTFVRQGAIDESRKPYPERYPGNADSIGIEIVGRALEVPGQNERVYERLSDEEQRSLNWLIPQLLETLHLRRTDIYRHPTVSRKNAGEASSATF